jgi:hypothetical protein
MVFWWRIVTPEWVRLPAEAYAEQLLAALNLLRDDEPRAARDAV